MRGCQNSQLEVELRRARKKRNDMRFNSIVIICDTQLLTQFRLHSIRYLVKIVDSQSFRPEKHRFHQIASLPSPPQLKIDLHQINSHSDHVLSLMRLGSLAEKSAAKALTSC